jgi:hypothetical protein
MCASAKALRWSKFEFFVPDVDAEWYARHPPGMAGLLAAGRPVRRFSEAFLRAERAALMAARTAARMATPPVLGVGTAVDVSVPGASLAAGVVVACASDDAPGVLTVSFPTVGARGPPVVCPVRDTLLRSIKSALPLHKSAAKRENGDQAQAAAAAATPQARRAHPRKQSAAVVPEGEEERALAESMALMEQKEALVAQLASLHA